MSDLISRQAVINTIANTCFWLSADNWEELVNCINSIPSVENKGEWIDDVKSEIDKAQEPYITNTAYDEGVRFGLMLAYQIVDRCKAESEEQTDEEKA